MCEEADKFIFITLAQTLIKKLAYQLFIIKEYGSWLCRRMSSYLNYFLCYETVNSKKI